MATTKGVVLSRSIGLTKAEANETIRNLRKAGLIPADLKVEFVLCGSGGLHVGGRAVVSRTAGQRWAFQEAQEVRS